MIDSTAAKEIELKIDRAEPLTHNELTDYITWLRDQRDHALDTSEEESLRQWAYNLEEKIDDARKAVAHTRTKLLTEDQFEDLNNLLSY